MIATAWHLLSKFGYNGMKQSSIVKKESECHGHNNALF